MRAANPLVLNPREDSPAQIRSLQTQIERLTQILQGRVAFGVGTDGISGQNMSGEFQQFTSHATPDTEFTVNHTLGSIPQGYLILWQDLAGSLYQSPTSGTDWTSTQIFLKSAGSSVTYLIFLVKKGQVE